METSLIDQGIKLMLVGMGTVFFFLGLLVVGMLTMSTIALKFAVNTATVTSPEGANDEEIAAITVAIAQHRKIQTK